MHPPAASARQCRAQPRIHLARQFGLVDLLNGEVGPGKAEDPLRIAVAVVVADDRPEDVARGNREEGGIARGKTAGAEPQADFAAVFRFDRSQRRKCFARRGKQRARQQHRRRRQLIDCRGKRPRGHVQLAGGHPVAGPLGRDPQQDHLVGCERLGGQGLDLDLVQTAKHLTLQEVRRGRHPHLPGGADDQLGPIDQPGRQVVEDPPGQLGRGAGGQVDLDPVWGQLPDRLGPRGGGRAQRAGGGQRQDGGRAAQGVLE